MNTIGYVWLLCHMLAFCSAATLYSCPTCLGRVRLQSEPFFAKQFYESEKQHDYNDNQQPSGQESQTVRSDSNSASSNPEENQ